MWEFKAFSVFSLFIYLKELMLDAKIIYPVGMDMTFFAGTKTNKNFINFFCFNSIFFIINIKVHSTNSIFFFIIKLIVHHQAVVRYMANYEAKKEITSFQALKLKNKKKGFWLWFFFVSARFMYNISDSLRKKNWN